MSNIGSITNDTPPDFPENEVPPETSNGRKPIWYKLDKFMPKNPSNSSEPKTLDLSYREINSLEHCHCPTSLQTLNLIGNKITSLEPLSGSTNLTTLNLCYNEITSLEPLSGSTNLQILILIGNEDL